MQNRAVFPFTAIVGQPRMQQALVLNAVDCRIGGVLIRGERGTAKSTAARGLAALLPRIQVISGCRFNCDPETPKNWCSECLERRNTGQELQVVTAPTPFVNLPLSATEDRVVGTLDIEKAIQKGERSFEPGVLALANRGLLYIDEVNLLDDHVVDLLLDSAAMGVNIVERESISFAHPARFMLVGTMNPDEGELRPQILDRFGLSIEVRGVRSARDRATITERCLLFENDPVKFGVDWAESEKQLSEKIGRARVLVDQIAHTQNDLAIIATLTAELGVDGHRADLVILKTARAHAAFEGRAAITLEDIRDASLLALPHRLKQRPMDPIQTYENLSDKVSQILRNLPASITDQGKTLRWRH